MPSILFLRVVFWTYWRWWYVLTKRCISRCQSQRYSNGASNCLAILSRRPWWRWFSWEAACLIGTRMPKLVSRKQQPQLQRHPTKQPSKRKHNLSSSRKKYWEINCENFITLVVMNGSWCLLLDIFFVGEWTRSLLGGIVTVFISGCCRAFS